MFFIQNENNNLSKEGNELIKNVNGHDYFLNIILKIENNSLSSNELSEFLKNPAIDKSEILMGYDNKTEDDFKNKIIEIFLSDDIEPDQFEYICPNYKYFIYSDFPSFEQIKIENENKDNYIFIDFYKKHEENSNNNSRFDPSKIIKINNFETKILDFYNNVFFISKPYTNQKIKDVLPKEFEEDFEEFKSIVNELYPDFSLDNEKKLENVLNAKDESNKIHNFYLDIIERNNKYINIFIEYMKNNKLSKYWEKFLNETFLAQNLYSKYNFFSFNDEMIQADKFDNLYEILIYNSMRHVIYKDGKIYLKNSKTINYKLNKIEKLLETSFLMGKSLFKKDQIFIEYNEFDAFNKNIFYDFNKLIKQKRLDNDRKIKIKNILEYKDENKKKEILKYIKKIMNLKIMNNKIEKPNKYFESEINNDLLEMKIKDYDDQYLVDLYEFIELSIIDEKINNAHSDNNKEEKKDIIPILRKFYLRFVEPNLIDKKLQLTERLFDNNKDLFFKIQDDDKEILNELEKIKKKFIEYIKNNVFEAEKCFEIYSFFQDEELNEYQKLNQVAQNDDYEEEVVT